MSDHIAVDILRFRDATRDITFDLFLKISDGNFAHVFSKNTGLDYSRLAQYIQKGVTELYIRSEDKEAFEQFITRPADSIFHDPEVTTEKKIVALLNMTEQNMTELFLQISVPPSTVASTRKVIRNYVELMTASPKNLSLILRLASHGNYLYYHSISVAIFSMFIAKATGQFNRRTLEIVGLGGFLHDIGNTQLPHEVNESPTELTPTQWKIMRSHPRVGLKMIEGTTNIPDEVKYIVYQHHEQPSGQGYPNGLHGPVIYYPSKVVALADAFSALISSRPFRPAFTVPEAIQIIRSEKGKFDPQLVEVLVNVFGKSGEAKAA